MFPVRLKMSLISAQLLQILMELGWKDIYFPIRESQGFMGRQFNGKTSGRDRNLSVIFHTNVTHFSL